MSLKETSLTLIFFAPILIVIFWSKKTCVKESKEVDKSLGVGPLEGDVDPLLPSLHQLGLLHHWQERTQQS